MLVILHVEIAPIKTEIRTCIPNVLIRLDHSVLLKAIIEIVCLYALPFIGILHSCYWKTNDPYKQPKAHS